MLLWDCFLLPQRKIILPQSERFCRTVQSVQFFFPQVSSALAQADTHSSFKRRARGQLELCHHYDDRTGIQFRLKRLPAR
jgi:hypothetical protein